MFIVIIFCYFFVQQRERLNNSKLPHHTKQHSHTARANPERELQKNSSLQSEKIKPDKKKCVYH